MMPTLGWKLETFTIKKHCHCIASSLSPELPFATADLLADEGGYVLAVGAAAAVVRHILARGNIALTRRLKSPLLSENGFRRIQSVEKLYGNI